MTRWALRTMIVAYGLLLGAGVWRAIQKHDGAMATKVLVIGVAFALVVTRAIRYVRAIFFSPAPRGFKSR